MLTSEGAAPRTLGSPTTYRCKFQGGSLSIDLTPLYRQLPKKNGEQDSVWPVLSLTIYVDRSAEEAGPPFATLLRAYIDGLLGGTLKATLIKDQVGPLSVQRLRRHLQSLAKPGDFEMKIYSSSIRGQPSDFGCSLMLRKMSSAQQRENNWSQIVRLEFPWAEANSQNIDVIAAKLMHLADFVPFACAVGELVAELGGTGPLEKSLPVEGRTLLNHGVCLRAAFRPPVGDVDRLALDIGLLPTVARWLKPKRFTTRSFAGSQVDMDTASWLARFDGLSDRAWQNDETYCI